MGQKDWQDLVPRGTRDVGARAWWRLAPGSPAWVIGREVMMWGTKGP